MCILIVKPAKSTVTEEVLRTCHENNKDGCGFSYVNTDHLGNRTIVIKKSMDFETFLRQYNRAQRVSPESNFIIHFRIGTEGELSVFNCHPFKIDDNHCFAHNGIISGLRKDKRMSDTQIFNEDILKKLPEGWMENEAITTLIESRITYNKLAVMNLDGDIKIYNASKGEMVGDVWFSNSTYKKRTYVTSTYSNRRVAHNPMVTTKALVKYSEDVDENSYEACDDCQIKVFKLKDQFQYYYDGSCSTYCTKCSSKYGKKEPIDVSCYLDWLNSDHRDAFDTGHTYFKTWVNPWNTGIDYTDTEIDYLEDCRYNAYGIADC